MRFQDLQERAPEATYRSAKARISVLPSELAEVGLEIPLNKYPRLIEELKNLGHLWDYTLPDGNHPNSFIVIFALNEYEKPESYFKPAMEMIAKYVEDIGLGREK